MGYLTQTLVYSIYGVAHMPDTRFWYTVAEISEAFDILGTTGLHVWLQVHLLDFLFPIGYSFSLAFGLAMEVRTTYPERIALRQIVLIPIVAGLLDYAENLIIASQILVYPNLSGLVISMASLVTAAKWTILYLAFVLVLVLLLAAIFQRFRKE
jgi:hypothetical protein